MQVERKVEQKKVGICDTTLRDAHQSLIATRMKTEDMVEISKVMDRVGYHSLEVWGGATFDSCLRFLNEDPWKRLRQLRQAFKNTKLLMLLRGQNLVGYRHYPDEVVEEFIKRSVANGIDIIRIFDALNDVRNLEKVMTCTKQEGAHVQGAICYTISPVHNIDYFVQLGSKFKEMGADSICVKDMGGLIAPYDAAELVGQLKQKVGLPVQLHSHYTSGMASMSYLKAIEAGADVIDTAAAPFSLGSSQPPTDSLVAALANTPYDTGLDLKQLVEISAFFKEVIRKYDIPEMATGVDTGVLTYQIPGGMISNLTSQLAEQNASHLFPEVLKEVPRVRKDLGYPPLVTPSSQIVGTQAVFNVLLGERYKMVSTEIKNYLRGLYGRPPAAVNQEVLAQVLKGEQPLDIRPADLLKPVMEESREKIKELMEQEEDLLSYILFPQVALEFFKKRREQGSGANPGVSALADEKTPGCASGGGGAVRNSSDDDEDPVYPA